MNHVFDKSLSRPYTKFALHPLVGLWMTFGAFLLCVLISLTPIVRLAGTGRDYTMLTDYVLTLPGAWLPVNLGFDAVRRASELRTHTLFFLILVGLEFICYGLALLLLKRLSTPLQLRRALQCIWIGAFVAGLLFVLTPALLSRDAYVYAGYGRVLAIHHANPYFIAPSAFPEDPLLPFNNWKDAPAAYGPFWLVVTALGALLAQTTPANYILLYRLLNLTVHLINISLIYNILRTKRVSPTKTVLGTCLYAWNPLVLQENVLGGHNDIVMLLFILLGVSMLVRVETRYPHHITRLRGFVLPLVFFSLAALIKFTALPLLALAVVFLTIRALKPASGTTGFQWQQALSTGILASLCCAVPVLGFYLPFWVGHSITDILYSFTSPPSANSAYASILAAYQNWLQVQTGDLPFYGLLQSLAIYKLWQNANTLIMASLLLVGIIWLWVRPMVRTLICALTAILGALLIVTPWFFPWYLTWIIGLAPLCLLLPERDRPGYVLAGFTLAFSFSAHAFYWFYYDQPYMRDWLGFNFLWTVGLPILVFLLLWFWRGSGFRTVHEAGVVTEGGHDTIQ